MPNLPQLDDNQNIFEGKSITGSFVDANILLLEAKQKINNHKIKDGLDILHHLTMVYPEYAKTYNLLGWVYDSLMEDTTTAEKYYKKCLDLSPDFKDIYSNYAYCLLVLKKYETLEVFLIDSLKISFTNKPYLYHLLGKTCEALQKFNEAIIAYENSILQSFDTEDIVAREKDIQRCQKKKEFLEKKHTVKPKSVAKTGKT